MLACVPFETAAAQGGELARFVAMYRAGNSEQAAAGLLALSRVAQSVDQRALVEYHLGLALLRTRPAEASAPLRRSIAIDPDLRPDSAATTADRRAWDEVRSQMAIPTSVRFEPATVIAGAGDSVGVFVDVPGMTGSARPRVRVLLGVGQGKDPIELWAGTAGERGTWDGTFRNEPPQSGAYPLIIEVLNESGEAPVRWRRSLQVSADALSQPLALSPRPRMINAMTAVRVRDTDQKKRSRRRGVIWTVGGTLVSFAASRMVPDAVKISAPNSGPRIALASVYGAGLAGALFGATKLTLSATRSYETTVLVPDEQLLRRQRYQESSWLADSARVTSLNARRESLRRVTVQVQERR